MTWQMALDNKLPALQFLDDICKDINLDEENRNRLRQCLGLKIAQVSEESEYRPVGIAIIGPDAAVKRAFAEGLAARLGTEFVYVDCAEYAEREERARGTEATVIQVTDSSGELLLANELPSVGMLGWMFDAVPGYIYRDVPESLAKTLVREPFCTIYMDNIEVAGERFLDALRRVCRDGAISGSKIDRNGIAVGGSIFIASTDIYTDEMSKYYIDGQRLHEIVDDNCGIKCGILLDYEVIEPIIRCES